MKSIVNVHVESDSTIINNDKVTYNENKRYGEFAHCVLIVEKAILAGLAIGGSTLYSIIFWLYLKGHITILTPTLNYLTHNLQWVCYPVKIGIFR